ncbi:hypothetical protein, partial [Klebsiella pneumoniae]|uniref:hypothetical protein n=1 Tax=Klebsiella pneumoniae TaxID=573 RepID=UPI002730024D
RGASAKIGSHVFEERHRELVHDSLRIAPVPVAVYAAFTMLVLVFAAYLVFDGLTQPIALPKVIAGAMYGAIVIPGIVLTVTYFEKVDRR